MQTFDPAGGIAQESFRLFGIFLRCSIFLAGVAVCHWGVRTCFSFAKSRWKIQSLAQLILGYKLRRSLIAFPLARPCREIINRPGKSAQSLCAAL